MWLTVTSSDPVGFAVSPSFRSGSSPVTVAYTQNPLLPSLVRTAEIVFSTTDPAIETQTLTSMSRKVLMKPWCPIRYDPGWNCQRYRQKTILLIFLTWPVWREKVSATTLSGTTPKSPGLMGGLSALYRNYRAAGVVLTHGIITRKYPNVTSLHYFTLWRIHIRQGHQLPSADRLYSQDVNASTFYFTNLTAQNPSFNQNLWARLEINVRDWARMRYSICSYRSHDPDSGRSNCWIC